jgi:hypothetical protein
LAQAANPGDRWEQLAQLRAGDKVRVEVRGKPEVTGSLAAVTPDSLQLVHGKKEQIDLKKTEIRRVYRIARRPRGRSAAPWIGAGAGFGIGFAAGQPLGYAPGCRFICIVSKPAAGTVIGLAGAALGATAGHFAAGHFAAGKTETLVYKAR